MKTVFITGASTGIGKETAKLFQSKNWNAVATMRNPQAGKELSYLKNRSILPCDVTDHNSIERAISGSIDLYGGMDVLINNAGYYLFGPAELATYEQVKNQLDTNLLGLIDVTQKIIPYFREKNSGTIINLSSIAGKISIPLQSLYHASKWGVEGFSESLQYELRQFNIQVKIIEQRVIKTEFLGQSMVTARNSEDKVYNSYYRKVIKNIYKNGEKGSDPIVVAETIYKAATDGTRKLRYPTGNSKSMVFIHDILPQKVYNWLIKNAMER